jgi:hypothetical protein
MAIKGVSSRWRLWQARLRPKDEDPFAALCDAIFGRVGTNQHRMETLPFRGCQDSMGQVAIPRMKNAWNIFENKGVSFCFDN